MSDFTNAIKKILLMEKTFTKLSDRVNDYYHAVSGQREKLKSLEARIKKLEEKISNSVEKNPEKETGVLWSGIYEGLVKFKSVNGNDFVFLVFVSGKIFKYQIPYGEFHKLFYKVHGGGIYSLLPEFTGLLQEDKPNDNPEPFEAFSYVVEIKKHGRNKDAIETVQGIKPVKLHDGDDYHNVDWGI